MKTLNKTALYGANRERTAILAKVRGMMEDIDSRRERGKRFLEYLEAWILLRNERYQKRKGGLGRK